MAVKIRLARAGAKKRPFYRIVVAEATAPRDGRFIAKIGTFDPMKAKDAADRVILDTEAAKSWLAKGAQPTDRVLRFLDQAGLMKRPARNNPEKAKPGTKAAGAPDRQGEEGSRRRRRRRSGRRAGLRSHWPPSPLAGEGGCRRQPDEGMAKPFSRSIRFSLQELAAQGPSSDLR